MLSMCTTSTLRGSLPLTAKLSISVGIDRDRGAAVDAQRLADAGNEEQQRDARVAQDIAEAVDAVVAGPVGQRQRALVENAHEAGRVALGRTVEPFGAAGRDRDEGRGLDQLAVARR